MFEYLLEHGAIVAITPSKECYGSYRNYAIEDTRSFRTMFAYREVWITQAAPHLIGHYRLPLTAIRTIHEYVFRYNWSSVCAQLCDIIP